MTKDAMTQQPGLRAGSLAGQDLSLLRKGDWVWDRIYKRVARINDSKLVQGFAADNIDFLGPDAGGWIAWRGGENPVDQMVVEAKLATGAIMVKRADHFPDVAWSNVIIAFRPAPSAVEPAPEAVSSEGEALKPCPFCGGNAHALRDGMWQTSCSECHSGTSIAYETRELSNAAWNRRTSRTPQQPDTLAEGLEVVAHERRHPDQGWQPVLMEDIRHYRNMGQDIRALTPHAEATRLLAERDREIEGLRAELADCREGRRMISSGAFDSGIIAESAVARAEAAEADAAKLREALQYGNDVAGLADEMLRARGLNVMADQLVEFTNRAERALAQTKRRT